jgi:hypothetical protein
MTTSITVIMKTQKTRHPEAGTLIGVRLQTDPLSKLDEWRRHQGDLPGRPEAIRRLIEQALSAPTAKITRIIASGDAATASNTTAARPRKKRR